MNKVAVVVIAVVGSVVARRRHGLNVMLALIAGVVVGSAAGSSSFRFMAFSDLMTKKTANATIRKLTTLLM